MIRFCLIVLGVTLSACVSAEVESGRAEQTAVANVSTEWVAAFRAGDIDQLVSLYTPDARVMSQGQHGRSGTHEIRAMFVELFAGEAVPEIRFEIEEIGLLGAGYAWASVLAKIDGFLPDETYLSRTFIVYRKDPEGNWRIFRDIDHATPDAAAVNDE